WLVDMKESCSKVVFFSRLWVPAEILQLKNDKYPELIIISVVNRKPVEIGWDECEKGVATCYKYRLRRFYVWLKAQVLGMALGIPCFDSLIEEAEAQCAFIELRIIMYHL
ncbi:hypothetical protein MKW98_032377, partial [Papaver atlanticum]